MTDRTDVQLAEINKTVTGIRVEFAEHKSEQKATNKSVETLCGKIDGYVTGTEKRFIEIEKDLGNRIPDDPTAFSQLQSLQAFKKRIRTNGRALWAFVGSLVLLGISQLTGFFKGH